MTDALDATVDPGWVGRHRLVLRADASATGGTGHAMRLLALAQAWRDHGGASTLVTAELPAGLARRFEAEDVALDTIAAVPGSPEDAATVGTKLGDPGSIGVVDGVQFRDAYFEALAPVAQRIVRVDDLGGVTTCGSRLILNQNLHADPAEYPTTGCRLLLGTRFTILRREFRVGPTRRPIPRVARHLLVTFGGSDPTRMTGRVLAALQPRPPGLADLQIRALVGAANSAGSDLARAAGPGTTIEPATDDMPSQLAWADLAITSGGSTVWELARFGVPSIVVETVPVETRLAAGLARIGLFDRLGPEASLGPDRIARTVAARVHDHAWRTEMSERGRETVDGRGADRVIAAMAEEVA